MVCGFGSLEVADVVVLQVDLHPCQLTGELVGRASRVVVGDRRRRVSADVHGLARLRHTFQIIEGRVFDVKRVRNRTYINFSKHWKSDFTIVVEGRNHRLFEALPGGIAALARKKNPCARLDRELERSAYSHDPSWAAGSPAAAKQENPSRAQKTTS